jgi:hypothetical protein
MPATTASGPGPREAPPERSWSAPLGEPWRAWIGLAVGVLAVSAHSALHFGTSPLLKPITDELGWTRSEYAMAMNLRLVLMMCVVPFAGRLVDASAPAPSSPSGRCSWVSTRSGCRA